MKKSLYAIIVVLLTSIGAHALAAIADVVVEKVSSESFDDSSHQNGNTGGESSGGNRGGQTLSK